MSAEFRTAVRHALRRLFRCHSIRNESGQAVVEYAIVFPVQLLLTLTIIQLAHLFIARQVLEYGAFCAARAVLVGVDPVEAQRAAIIPISAIAGPTGATTSDSSAAIVIPGWTGPTMSDAVYRKLRDDLEWQISQSNSPSRRSRLQDELRRLDDVHARGGNPFLPRAGAAMDKTRFVQLGGDSDDGHPVARCVLEHDYELRVPIGAAVIYGAARLGNNVALSGEGMNLFRMGDAPHVQMKASCTLAQPWE